MSGEIDDRAAAAGVRNVVAVVAHPDDETLWAGGLLLSHPSWRTTIVTLCRASDSDRAPRFHTACSRLGAEQCFMGDLDDGPEQIPLPPDELEETIVNLLPRREWDLLITHSPEGEYTSHLRHEEIARAVWRLWAARRIVTSRVWMFAYEDAGRTKSPEAIVDADIHFRVPEELFLRKYSLITEVYGFDFESWEARAVPHVEGFWEFDSPDIIARRFDAPDRTESGRGTDR